MLNVNINQTLNLDTIMNALVKTNRLYPNWVEQLLNADNLAFSHNFERTFAPSVNIRETNESFFIEAAAPGYNKEDFEIKVEKNLLSLSSERKFEHNEENGGYTRREFAYGSFKRTFTLPKSANTDAINANYVNGVLTIEIPKKDEEKDKPARTISIN